MTNITAHTDNTAAGIAFALAGTMSDKSATILKRAKLARQLTSIDDVTNAAAADLLKLATAAIRLNGTADDMTNPDVIAVAASVKISPTMVSQLVSAINRAETITDNKTPADLVGQLYTAATSGVKAGAINEIVKFASELATGKVDYALTELQAAMVQAGEAKREANEAKRKAANTSDTGDAAEGDDVTGDAKATNGAAAYTLASILRAVEAIAKREPEHAKAIRNMGTAIVAELAN